ncbi:recombinase family protein [Rheinheimera sp.]|uniref:recombinase family protein n=1 Tax=Rheinheimera sp. TaxID=1869214 RepID=UPI004047B979|tara:strand:- start:1736 stop:2662 length:927 start_codon:yes stop_codon:yes gene_type:complete
MKIGYARVSTREQHADLQIDALKQAGCEKIYQDIASGAKTARPELDKLLTHVRTDDIVVIWKLDRLGRSLKHLVELVGDLSSRNIGLKSLNDPIDTTNAQGRLVFNLFASLAEFERELIQERTQAGLTAARARGRVGGRPKGLPAQAEATAMAAETLYREGRLTVIAICKKLRISKSTLYGYLRHRSVEIGAYQKNTLQNKGVVKLPLSNTDATQCCTVTLRLAIENKNKSVRGKKQARENIERFCLEALKMQHLESGNYELSIPYASTEQLDKTVYELLSAINREADLRNCLVDAEIWEVGTDRRWQ